MEAKETAEQSEKADESGRWVVSVALAVVSRADAAGEPGKREHQGGGTIRRTLSLCLEVVATLLVLPDFVVVVGLEVDVVVVFAPPFARSFSSSSSSSSSRLFTASNLASIQSMTFPMVIAFPEPSCIGPARHGSSTPPTDTPCWIMSSRSWHAAP